MPTVLIVEDNEPSREALSRRLERPWLSRRPGGERRTGGRGGARIAARHHPDGSRIADHRQLGGDRPAETRRRHAAHPIIVLSAHAMTTDREQALAAGGDDFDTKPVKFDRLLEKIDTLLGRGAGR